MVANGLSPLPLGEAARSAGEGKRTPHFHSLKIHDVRRETKDCVSIAFDVPNDLRHVFAFKAGQYVNVRAMIDGEEIRRSYSLCSAPHSGEWRIAVKRVDDGAFSQFANASLKTGDSIDVMPPDGKFVFEADRDEEQHVLAVAAGSGITPILSIVTTLLEREPNSRVTLIYGNRHVRDIIFKEAIEDLRDRFLTRFQVVHVLSQEPQDSPISNGRVDKKKIQTICSKINRIARLNRAYVCGPGLMIDETVSTLIECGLDDSKIFRERFTAGSSPSRSKNVFGASTKSAREIAPSAEVTIIADGIERVLRVPFEGASVLEVALAASIDAPYACKAAVCCTCRAQVLEGKVKMDANFTLEQHEVNRGFVLTCQSHPITPVVKISYDAR
jgi:ring-1,2-phenylacetyl-CoA epoxidase subunit PaaE